MNPIHYDAWMTKYKPIKNYLEDNAAYDGHMFETYGKEAEEVKNHPATKVWTLVSDDNGDTVIVAGWHYVNRLGYFITEEEWESENEVVLDD